MKIWKCVLPAINKGFKLIPYQLNSITDKKKEFPIYRWLCFNWTKKREK